jgi:hypothetical protein
VCVFVNPETGSRREDACESGRHDEHEAARALDMMDKDQTGRLDAGFTDHG